MSELRVVSYKPVRRQRVTRESMHKHVTPVTQAFLDEYRAAYRRAWAKIRDLDLRDYERSG